jgi:hypothetical protein
MVNHSIWFLLLVLLALGAQLLLTWLLLAAARRIGARRRPLTLMLLTSGVLIGWLVYQRLPEQLPICTDSLLTYMQCLGF